MVDKESSKEKIDEVNEETVAILAAIEAYLEGVKSGE